MYDPNWQDTQVHVFLAMLLTFAIGWIFVDRSKRPRTPFDGLSASERRKGYKLTPSWAYRHYRNPMRTLRRWCGWPSGRQWKKLRKQWNREVPDGARKLAHVVSNITLQRKKEEKAA